MNLIQILSLFSVLFGILIVLQPALLAYLIAFFFIIVGVNGLLFGARLNKIWRVRINK